MGEYDISQSDPKMATGVRTGFSNGHRTQDFVNRFVKPELNIHQVGFGRCSHVVLAISHCPHLVVHHHLQPSILCGICAHKNPLRSCLPARSSSTPGVLLGSRIRSLASLLPSPAYIQISRVQVLARVVPNCTAGCLKFSNVSLYSGCQRK